MFERIKRYSIIRIISKRKNGENGDITHKYKGKVNTNANHSEPYFQKMRRGDYPEIEKLQKEMMKRFKASKLVSKLKIPI